MREPQLATPISTYGALATNERPGAIADATDQRTNRCAGQRHIWVKLGATCDRSNKTLTIRVCAGEANAVAELATLIAVLDPTGRSYAHCLTGFYCDTRIKTSIDAANGDIARHCEGSSDLRRRRYGWGSLVR